MRTKTLLAVVALGVGASFHAAHLAQAQVLVGSPFLSSYQNWVDPLPDRGGNWRLSLHQPTLMETSDLVPTGNNPAAANNNGSFVPTLLIQDGFTTPADYTLSARTYSSDDDGFGLVFGYQDSDNYFRITSRAQANGNLGGTNGLSVQKVVNGVVTQINPSTAVAGFNVDNSFTRIDNRLPYDFTVAVTGNDYAVSLAGANNDQPIWTGNDPALLPGKIGVHSWAQRNRTAAQPHWGTELESISVSSGAGTLYSGTFNGSPIPWRPLAMANSLGHRTNQTTAPIVGDDRGNFGVDFRNGWIYQQTNGFEWATTDAPNVDFLGPAVVVDTPGSASLSDYDLKIRMGARDDDGMGVLLRVQDDDNFYRVNVTQQAMGAPQADHERAPRGLSIQKVKGGVWSEVWRDDQNNPLFVYQPGGAGSTPSTGMPMFDLLVRAIGNTFEIQVTDHLGNVIFYPLITDPNDPLLTGTVGLHTWGNEHVYYQPYGGVDGPLLTVVPEPAAVSLAIGGAATLLSLRRRRSADGA